jgi:glycosyltransferase involved in cell wall biosynthesis
MRYTVVISTYNRARSLSETLVALAQIQTTRSWEVLVVDNRSTDDTAAVATAMAAGYPVELRYLYEPTSGKYHAMNTAVRAARGEIIAATDDDAVVDPQWLERADDALQSLQCDFVGGPVAPLWQRPPPAWLDLSAPAIQKVLALLDYGTAVREFGAGIGWPLGVNVAYRREAFAKAGLFNPSLGRKAGTLRSQAQREWHLRARGAGCRGFYVPDMRVQHRVEPERLERQYFRRWHYWHGISRARLYYGSGFDPEEPEAARYDRPLPSILGVPRRLFPKALASLRSWIWRGLRGHTAQAFEYELWLCFFAGLSRQCLRESPAAFGGGRLAAEIPDTVIAVTGVPDDLNRSVHASTTTGAGLV